MSAERLLASTEAEGLPGAAGELPGLLTLEAIEVDMFRACGTPGDPGRLFGGQVAAQALAAAGHTVTGAKPHSLHAYFLRQGDSSSPVLFQVDRLHDGRTFRRRRVTAIQQGQPILCLESSFTADDSVTDDYSSAPAVPAPEGCAVFDKPRMAVRPSPWTMFEARSVPGGGFAGSRVTTQDMWFRLRAGAIAESILPEAVITYLSDLTLAAAAVRPTELHPQGRPDVTRLTSLDHAVWFHNQARLSGWLLYTKAVPAAGPLRVVTSGQIFNRDGTLVATVAQETLLRLPRRACSGASRSASRRRTIRRRALRVTSRRTRPLRRPGISITLRYRTLQV